LRAGVRAAQIHNQLVDTVQTRGIRHYLTPAATGFARSIDFSCASLDASSAFVE
jgi:hypothetical protein